MHSYPLGLSSPSGNWKGQVDSLPRPPNLVEMTNSKYPGGVMGTFLDLSAGGTKDGQGTVLVTVPNGAQYRVHM